MSLRSHPNPLLRSLVPPDGIESPGMYYRFMRWMCQAFIATWWKVRVFNRHYEPHEGGAVYVSNHQSFMDPMLVGMALRRPMSFMARDSLFRAPGFGRLIESLNAFPVKRGTADTGALREAMRRLKAGKQVLVFAEGTRTSDGTVGPFLPGVALPARRAAKWIVPVVIDGAFEAWPRTSALPRPGNVVVQYARPLSRAEARKLEPTDFVRRVRDTIIEMQTDVRRRLGRPALKYD